MLITITILSFYIPIFIYQLKTDYVQIPAGTTVLIAVQAMSTLHFSKPDEFIPERWMIGHPLHDEVEPFATLYFGHGRRKCIGMRIAKLEINVLMVKLLQKFKISYHHKPIRTVNRVVNFPDQPLRFNFEDRKQIYLYV